MHPIENKEKDASGTMRLDGAARAMIDSYLALPLGAKPSCPYFNNRRRGVRSQLRVLKGKGAPHEIAEEAEINALHMRLTIDALPADKLKEFLVKQDLGVDCSGFAYHVLDALAREKTGKGLPAFVKSNRTGFVRSLLARLRPAENMGVATFANDRNSKTINASEARPGDIVVFLGTGKDGLYNHMVVITGIERIGSATVAGDERQTRIAYAHSYAWPSDGAYGHGVREGEILFRGGGDGDDLLKGVWTEKGATGVDNYTYESARTAKDVSARRLNFIK